MPAVKSFAVEEILISEQRPMKHFLIFGVLIALTFPAVSGSNRPASG